MQAAVCVRLHKKYLLKPRNKIQNLYVHVYAAAAAAAAVINITEFNLRTVLILLVVWSI